MKDQIIATDQSPSGKLEFRRIINLGTKLLELKIEHRKNEILISAMEEIPERRGLSREEWKQMGNIGELLIITEAEEGK